MGACRLRRPSLGVPLRMGSAKLPHSSCIQEFESLRRRPLRGCGSASRLSGSRDNSRNHAADADEDEGAGGDAGTDADVGTASAGDGVAMAMASVGDGDEGAAEEAAAAVAAAALGHTSSPGRACTQLQESP